MSEYPDYLTATDFYRLVQCPHWPYFERFHTPEELALKRDVTPAEQTRMENGVAHEQAVIGEMFKGTATVEVPQTKDAERDCEATFELMRKGTPIIYQGTLTDGDWTGRPDLLERREGPSQLGDWYYVPIDVKSTHHLEKYQKLQLTFYATLLERLQGRFPKEPAIINIDGERLPFDAVEMIKEFEETVVELERIRAGEIPDPVLRKSCYDMGTWGKACEQLATKNNDIALLFNVDVRKLRQLRGLGVRTVDDAAEMDPQALDGVAPGLRLHGLEVVKLQARSLMYKEVIVREPVSLPTEGLEIHFDIESDPPNDVDYLYGFLIRGADGDKYKAFVSKRLEGEGDMWREFLAWIETLPPVYSVYHFAAYERTRLSVLEARYGGNAALERFRENMIDLKEITTSSIVFPLYFYGLKYICPFLGFTWKGSVKGGGQSVDVFEKYIATQDRALLDAIIAYNEEDVRATAYLKDWLVGYAKKLTSYENPYPWKS